MINMHTIYSIAWDGELSMSGQPHKIRIGVEIPTLKEAQKALGIISKGSTKHNIHIESRSVSDWEVVE